MVTGQAKYFPNDSFSTLKELYFGIQMVVGLGTLLFLIFQAWLEKTKFRAI